MEALGAKIEEINAQKAEQEAMKKDQMMKAQAMEKAQAMGFEARSRASEMSRGGITPEGMPEDPEAINAAMGGGEVPQEYSDMAADMLMKGTGPMKAGKETMEEVAESLRNM
jgi:hypothetical protein